MPCKVDNRHIIDEQAVERIKKQGCCLGKYRVLIEGVYYCYLEGVFNCAHQDRQYVKKLNNNIFVCEPNNQVPCEECELYTTSKAITING